MKLLLIIVLYFIYNAAAVTCRNNRIQAEKRRYQETKTAQKQLAQLAKIQQQQQRAEIAEIKARQKSELACMEIDRLTELIAINGNLYNMLETEYRNTYNEKEKQKLLKQLLAVEQRGISYELKKAKLYNTSQDGRI